MLHVEQRAAAVKADEESRAQEARPTAFPEGFVKVPTQLLGKILDFKARKNASGNVAIFGHASASAVRSLVIKLAHVKHDAGWVLNETYLRNEYGIGWRSFNEGVTVLGERGVLTREQKGHRTFAEESIVEHPAEPFVQLDRRLLKERATLIAFVAAVKLSPEPRRPDQVARRFGVTSRATIRDLVKDAGQHIARHRDPRTGATVVARPGYDFASWEALVMGGVKNGATKNGSTKNGSTKNGVHINKRGDSKEEERGNGILPSLASLVREQGQHAAQAGPRSREADRAASPEDSPAGQPNGNGVPADGKTGLQEDARSPVGRPDFTRIVLASWRSAYFRRHGFRYAGATPEIDTLTEWRHQLRLYGGVGDQVHLLTDHAHRQACEIADELSALCPRVPLYAALLAVACAVCTAHREGRVIRSLGFIAEKLARHARSDWTGAWAFNLPRREIRVTDAQYDAAAAIAAEWADILASFEGGKRINAEALRSTPRIEELAEYLRDHGRDAMVHAINHVTADNVWEGRTVHGWGYFADYIDAARVARAAKEREQTEAEVDAIMRTILPTRPAYDHEAEVSRACAWVSGYLGSAWHQRVRLTWDARRAGIDDRALCDALTRLGCQNGRGVTGKQRRIAMPGVPPEAVAA